MPPVIKQYKTPSDGSNEDKRYAVWAEMMAADLIKMDPQVPRILNFQDLYSLGGYRYLIVTVLWETPFNFPPMVPYVGVPISPF